VKPAKEINMAHFTQLNLQGNSGSKPVPNPGSPCGLGAKTPIPTKLPKKQHGTAKVFAIAGSLAAAALVTTLTLGTNGCFESKPAITAPSSPMTSVPQTAPTRPLMASSSMAPAATPKPAKKSSRQRTFATYKNADFGISFRYPKTYSLLKDDKANLEWAGLGPVEMNFVQPGGINLAAVKLPDGGYPHTDFAAAFFNVSVNPKVTEEACEKFASEAAESATANISEDELAKGGQAQPEKMKLGAGEFTEVESAGGESARHANAKYYHVFQNGACYEFALGLETTDGKADVKPVDRGAVFNKLNWMLSTVKIAPAGVPAKAAPAIAAGMGAVPAATTAPEATAPSSPTTTPPAPTTTNVAAEGDKN
jgi:hypothetical protein